MMTSLNFVLTLALVAVTSCYTLAKPMSADSQLISLLSSRLLPRFHSGSYNLPAPSGKFSSQGGDTPTAVDEEEEAFNENSDDNSADSDDEAFSALTSPLLHNAREEAYILPADFPLYLQQSHLMSGQQQDAGLNMGRGKRYIPGLNALYMARLFGDRNAARFVDARKRKRQPHLGFHASRG